MHDEPRVDAHKFSRLRDRLAGQVGEQRLSEAEEAAAAQHDAFVERLDRTIEDEAAVLHRLARGPERSG